MKRFIGILAAAVIVLLLASPVLAATLGISPSHTELEVSGDGSATANFKVHYFSGDIKVSLVDIPLRVEPEMLHIEPSSEPVEIELTIYGDQSLGSQVYDGYVRFLGMSGETVAVAVRVKAKVTHIVEGQPVAEATEETPVPEASPPAPPGPPAATSGTTEWPIIPVAGFAVGTAIFITILVMVARRRQH